MFILYQEWTVGYLKDMFWLNQELLIEYFKDIYWLQIKNEELEVFYVSKNKNK